MDVNGAEWHIAHEMHAEHNHARYPEEYNVKSGDEIIIGVIGFKRFRLFRPTKSGKRPQTGRKPSIENIGILY